MRRLLPVVALALVAAACGDSGGDDAPPLGPGTTAATTTTAVTLAAEPGELQGVALETVADGLGHVRLAVYPPARPS